MAGKLIITRGLPGSGKSTWADIYATRSENYDTTRIVTMDDIRKAIGAQFAAGDESIVQSVRDFTIRQYLARGYTVISADTNLNPRTLQHIKDLAFQVMPDIPVEIQDFTDVPLDTCLERNRRRWAMGDCKVPDAAIIEMHDKFLKNQ